jgi:predicted 2-oxoglutarate/Fe(II)-dependent dioxygenase YbiX
MQNDPIVEEVRKNGVEFALRHNNDLAEICKALREHEALSGRAVVNLQAANKKSNLRLQTSPPI